MRMPLLNNFVGHSVTPSKVEGPVVVANGLIIGMRLPSCVCENSAAKSRKRGGRLLSNLLGDVLHSVQSFFKSFVVMRSIVVREGSALEEFV